MEPAAGVKRPASAAGLPQAGAFLHQAIAASATAQVSNDLTSRGKYWETYLVSMSTLAQCTCNQFAQHMATFAARELLMPADSSLADIVTAMHAHTSPHVRQLASAFPCLLELRADVQELYNAAQLVYRTPGADITTLMQLKWRDQHDIVRKQAEPDLVLLTSWEEKRQRAMEALGQKLPSAPGCLTPLGPSGSPPPGRESSAHRDGQSPGHPRNTNSQKQGGGRRRSRGGGQGFKNGGHPKGSGNTKGKAGKGGAKKSDE